MKYHIAVRKLNKALALDPKFADTYARVAAIYQGEGMNDETMAVIDKGLAIVPNDEILLMMRQEAENYRRA